MGIEIAPWNGQFGGKMACIGTYIGRFAMSCAKTGEQIGLPFSLWIRVGPSKHKFNRVLHVAPMCPTGPMNYELDGVQISPRELTILKERGPHTGSQPNPSFRSISIVVKGRPSQLLLSTCTNDRDIGRTVLQTVSPKLATFDK